MEGLPVSYSLNSGDNGNNWWGDFIGATIRDEQDKTRALISQLDREQLLRESAAKDAKIAQLEAFQFNTALAAGNAQQTRNEMQGQTALILAALRDRTPASSGGASA